MVAFGTLSFVDRTVHSLSSYYTYIENKYGRSYTPLWFSCVVACTYPTIDSYLLHMGQGWLKGLDSLLDSLLLSSLSWRPCLPRVPVPPKECRDNCVSDPNPYWIRIRIRIRIQEGKNLNDQQKLYKILRNFMIWSGGCSLLRAEGFFCSLDVLYGGLGIGKLQSLIKKILNFCFSCKFFLRFSVTKDPGSGLNPESDRYSA